MYEMKCMTNGFFVGNTIVKIVGNGMGEDHHGDPLARGKDHELSIELLNRKPSPRVVIFARSSNED